MHGLVLPLPHLLPFSCCRMDTAAALQNYAEGSSVPFECVEFQLAYVLLDVRAIGFSFKKPGVDSCVQ